MSASKLYGGRWKIIGSLGEGGQGQVFRVQDSSGQLEGEFALKRLRDLQRIDRFRNEVDALRRANHPNIIKLIDSSDLNAGGDEARHFLVMPIAQERDAEKRRPLFQGSIENTVKVALQVAQALKASHDLRVIHRDVKPANILFPSQSLDIWLSDFGICHVPKEVADTQFGDIMGPRRFAAPEIEAGRKSEVLPSVDVYSLGQVIFYLLSGGQTFYREDVYDERYNTLFSTGERSQLLRSLLSRMVVSNQNRIQNMDDVIVGLSRVRDWENQAQIGTVEEGLRSKILALRRKTHQDDVALQKHDEIVARLKAQKDAVLDGIESSLKAELTAIASLLSEDGVLTASVTQAGAIRQVILLGDLRLHPVRGAELSVSKSSRKSMGLKLHMVVAEVPTTTIRHLRPGERLLPPVSDEQPLAVLPLLITMHDNSLRQVIQIFSGKNMFMLNHDNHKLSFTTAFVPRGSSFGVRTNEQITVNMIRFDASEWPENQPVISKCLSDNAEYFIDIVDNN